jgi:hypothetical protein
MRTLTIAVTPRELETLMDALDSHRYWQLSDEHHRNNGYVDDVGSDEPEMRTQIRRCTKLEERLRRALEIRARKRRRGARAR